MPLYTSFAPDHAVRVLVWKITESLDTLLDGLQLSGQSLLRLQSMKSENQQKAFLSVRKLLLEMNYSDSDLYYNGMGKPFLADGVHISITHSFIFSAIIVSERPVGIDIELLREKIVKIAPKFIGREALFLTKENYIRQLTVIWGAKEALYKLLCQQGISFKSNLEVAPFKLEDKTAQITLNTKEPMLKIAPQIFYFETLENFTLVYLIKR